MNSIPEDLRVTSAASDRSHRPSAKVCPYCKIGLTIHQEVRGGICDKLTCRTKRAVEFDLRRRRKEAEDLWQMAVGYLGKVAQRTKPPDPDSMRLTLIAHFDQPILKLPRARRSEFRAHLKEIIRQAFEEKLDLDAVARLEVELRHQAQTSVEDPTVGASCAVCKGYCCRNGGDRAYLDVAVIRSFMAQNPGLRAGQVLKAYLRRLPDASFKESCVYHGPGGCGLSREMRSHVCNNYFCNGMKSLRKEIESQGSKTVLLVAAEEMKITKSALIEPNGDTVRLDPRAIEE